VLTVVGLMLRSGAWGAVILPGIWFLGSALVVPASPDADRMRSELEREVERERAVYARSAQLDWIATWNDNPRPFTWTKTADEILNSLAIYLGKLAASPADGQI
jgi:hypothetical protein